MSGRIIKLRAPQFDGECSLEAALRERRSVREYSDESLTLAEISQLLWAAQGVTHRDGRTAPSAGALFPLEIYVVVVRADGLAPGLYRYRIGDHELLALTGAGAHAELTAAALGQDCVRDAAAVFAIGAVVGRTAVKYGDRAERYVLIEVGAAAQNMSLQAAALGLGTVVVGAYDDARVRRVLCMEGGKAAYVLMPVGRPRGA
ncbi:MAG: SagB/ThcOx family dehydrogenase [Gemmatimonadales bacterium]